jgi:hydrogenase maturation protease
MGVLRENEILILGVGNPILCDDGVGVQVARELKPLLKDTAIVVDEAYTGGLPLVDMMKGYKKTILIDALKSPQDKNGSIKHLTVDNLPTTHSANPHDMSLYTAIQLAKKMGEVIPSKIVIFGIVVNTSPCFGEHLSPKIKQSVPRVVESVLEELKIDCDKKIMN